MKHTILGLAAFALITMLAACGPEETDSNEWTDEDALSRVSNADVSATVAAADELGQDYCSCNPGWTPEAFCDCNGGTGCSSGTCGDGSSCSCSGTNPDAIRVR